jgi:hypothetical protein
LRAAHFAGLAVGLTLLGSVAAHATDAKSFLGFRLLDLEDQTVKWQNPTFGQGATVTYAFVEQRTKTPGARNCAAMNSPDHAHLPSGISDGKFRQEVAAAFRMWEQVANIKFRETDDRETAGILIGAQVKPVGRAFTNVSLMPSTGKQKVIERSLICLNPKRPWKVGFDGRLDVYDLRYTMAHEIGHAIGLDHPSASGVLMSYRYDERHRSLQPGDIKGAALLYGPRPGTVFTGDTASITTGSTNAPAAKDAGQPFGIGAKPGGPADTTDPSP